MSTKVIVIHANPDVQQWVGSLKPEWDVQIPVLTPGVVWDYLDQGTLSQESEIVFISDLLFAESPDDFAVVVASFAPSALVIVTVEDESLQPQINDAISRTVSEYSLASGPYYFFDTADEDPETTITNIVTEHAQYLAELEASTPVEPETSVPGFTPAPVPDIPVSEDLTELEAFDPTTPNVPVPAQQAGETKQFEGYTADEIANIQNNLGEPGLVVASTSTKGGSGKTTTALCTAITIAMGSRIASERGSGYPPLKVLVIDMDVRDGQIGFAINQTSPSILTMYVEEANESLETIQNHIISVPRFEIDCLLAPKRGRTADYLTPQFYLDVLHKLRLLYDVIILDTSVNYLDPLLAQVIYPESDAILLVTNLSKGAVLSMPRWMEEVTTSEDGGPGIQKEKIGVVINQSLGGVGMDLDLVRKAARGAPLLVAIPADNRAVTKASNEGTLNDLIRKHEQIGKEYAKLASKVWQKTPLVSPLEDYLASPEKERDDVLAAKGKTDESRAVTTFTPLGEADTKEKRPEKPKRGFGRR